MPGAADFPETADIETSSDAYARRFQGPTGEWFLRVQARIAMSMLDRESTPDVLDVGGGHAQLAAPLCREGFRVTVVGSAASCRRRLEDLIAAGRCRFERGNVVELSFPDRAFGAAVCFRLLTHCGRWRALIAELCRVAGVAVLVDYPTSQSLNRAAPRLFRAKRRIEGDTRTWTLFRHEEVAAEFARHGFADLRREAQFFLPMVLHRALRCRTVSAVLEGAFRAAGLTARWGSPVILRAVRRPVGETAEAEVRE